MADQLMVSVVLIKPHTHNGQLKEAGETLVLPLASARWLLEQKCIAKIPPRSKPTNSTQEKEVL